MVSDSAGRNQQIVALYAAGVPLRELATRFGLTHQRISQICTLGGVKADASRAVRRELRDKELNRLVESFLSAYRDCIGDLAAMGLARADIEARLTLLLADTPPAVIRESLKSLTRSKVIFNVNVQEYVFPTVAIEYAVWYVLARDLNLQADISIALPKINLVEAQEVDAVLDQQNIRPITRAEILTLVACAQVHRDNNPTITISKKRYEAGRSKILATVGPAQGITPWPPTAQTVMKRLGRGYWGDALRNIGLAQNDLGRERGLLKFSEENYENAVVSFLVQAAATGGAATFEAYGDWVNSEERAGRRRPSPPSIRLRYDTWNNAKRIVAASELLMSPGLRMQPATGATRPSVGALARHKAQDELRKFMVELEQTAPSDASRLAEEFITNYAQEFEYSRRSWLRAVISLDADAPSRRRQVPGLSPMQRVALDQVPPDLDPVLTDMYLDRMLSGPNGGPRNTDSWLSSEAQAELDALPADVVARVKVLREARNCLTHRSSEAKNRLGAALATLAIDDNHFAIRKDFSPRVLLDWLIATQAQRLRSLAQAIPDTWRAMEVVESILPISAQGKQTSS